MSANAIYQPSEAFAKNAHVSGMAAYQALCKEAETDYEGYWGRLAKELITWKKPFTKVLNESNAPFFKWFEDGTLNASYNCLDRNIEKGLGDKTALIFEADGGEVTKVSYSQLLAKTCQYANALKSLGVKKGDRVMIYIAMSIDGVAAMQACARIGATHSVVFGGFSAQSLRDRLEDTGAVALITADCQVRGGKQLPLKSIVDEAIALGGCGALKNVLVVKRGNMDIAMTAGRDLWMADVADKQPTTCEPEWVEAEHPLFLLYTSGSTGKPKGAMISYANIATMAPGVIERLGLDEATTHLSYLPLCHVAEQMLTTFVPLYLGSRVDFGESIRTVQEDLREVAPNMFLGVPRIWEKMHSAISIKMQETGRWRRWLYERAMAACEPFAHKSAAQRGAWESLVFGACYWLVFRALQNFIGLRRVRIALTGAAPISPVILRYFRTLGVPLVEVYGMTESSGMVLGQRPDDIVFGTVGAPTVGVEARLSPQGELQIRGGVVFKGYYKNPEATAQAVVDGWLHTGDVVEARDGHLRIVDRLKDVMITAGGKNLTPSAIENTMKASPFIKECVIVADGRKYVAALIQVDFETTAAWAEQRQIAEKRHFHQIVLLILREYAAQYCRAAILDLHIRLHMLGIDCVTGADRNAARILRHIDGQDDVAVRRDLRRHFELQVRLLELHRGRTG